MKKLIAFILGMVTIITLIPILESITELICANLEVFKMSPMKKVLVANNEIQDLQAQLEPVCTQAIGFSMPSTSYEDDEWEEDKAKVKNKIGFR